MMHPLFLVARAAFDSLSLTTALSVRKRAQGDGRHTFGAPWRQGTKTGSDLIVLLTISTVNSQRQRGQHERTNHGKEPKHRRQRHGSAWHWKSNGLLIGDFNGDGQLDVGSLGDTKTGVGACGPLAVYVYLKTIK